MCAYNFPHKSVLSTTSCDKNTSCLKVIMRLLYVSTHGRVQPRGSRRDMRDTHCQRSWPAPRAARMHTSWPWCCDGNPGSLGCRTDSLSLETCLTFSLNCDKEAPTQQYSKGAQSKGKLPRGTLAPLSQLRNPFEHRISCPRTAGRGGALDSVGEWVALVHERRKGNRGLPNQAST